MCICKQTNPKRNRKIHETFVEHLKDTSSCTNCAGAYGCFLLKQALSNLGDKVFLEKAIAGELPINVQEFYNKKFSAFAENSKS